MMAEIAQENGDMTLFRREPPLQRIAAESGSSRGRPDQFPEHPPGLSVIREQPGNWQGITANREIFSDAPYPGIHRF